MTDEYGKCRTTARIDADLMKDVRIACIHRGINQTEAMEQGLRLWLAATADKSDGTETGGV